MRNFFTELLPGMKREGSPTPGAEPEAKAPAASGLEQWGLSLEHVTAAYPANDLFSGERAMILQFRSGFYYARLHDLKPFDMNGEPINASNAARTPGFPGSQGFLATSGGAPERFVPIKMRRPDAPYRLSRSIVKAFTAMIWGENRWPQIRSDDPQTQAFCEALVKASNLKNRMHRERNVRGACGTSGLSWFFRAGKPVVHVHNGRFIDVLEWEDPDEYIPRHVTELYRSSIRKMTDEGPIRVEVWQRRDWTTVADVVFKPVEVTSSDPVEWVVDEERSYPHNDGECHFVWIPNFPDDEDPASVDGQPDYAELYEQLDTLDGSNSMLVRGVNKNLDPTLVLKREDPRSVKVVRKGSDNAIVTEPTGDAKYLTLESTIVDTGEKLVNMQRRQVLEVAQCVIPDPETVASAGTSSLTMKLVYAPMIGASDLLREPSGTALVRILEQMLRSARRALGEEPTDSESETEEEPTEETEPEATNAEEQSFTEDNEEARIFEPEDLPPEEQEPERSEVSWYLDLPPRIIEEPMTGPDGAPVPGKTVKKAVEQHPGSGKIELEWGDYFPPTSDDKQKQMTTFATAAGGKAIVSQQTAVESTAALLNKDASDEWDRVQKENEKQNLELPDSGGRVDNMNEGFAEPSKPEPSEAPKEPDEAGGGAEA